jgi:hypothetical protein
MPVEAGAGQFKRETYENDNFSQRQRYASASALNPQEKAADCCRGNIGSYGTLCPQRRTVKSHKRQRVRHGPPKRPVSVQKHLIVAYGLQNISTAETSDVVLPMPKGEPQKVKRIVETMGAAAEPRQTGYGYFFDGHGPPGKQAGIFFC